MTLLIINIIADVMIEATIPYQMYYLLNIAIRNINGVIIFFSDVFLEMFDIFIAIIRFILAILILNERQKQIPVRNYSRDDDACIIILYQSYHHHQHDGYH